MTYWLYSMWVSPQLTEQHAVHIERAKRLHEMAQI